MAIASDHPNSDFPRVGSSEPVQAETPMGAIAVEAPVQWIPIAPETSVAEAIHALLESSRSCSLPSHAPQTQDEQATAIDPPSRTLPNRSNPAQTAPPQPLPPRHPTPYPQAVLLVVENTPRLASSQNPRARSTLETDTGSRTRTNDAIGVVTATDLLRAQFLGFNLTRLTIAEIMTPWQPGDLPESLAETLPETLEPPAIPASPAAPLQSPDAVSPGPLEHAGLEHSGLEYSEQAAQAQSSPHPEQAEQSENLEQSQQSEPPELSLIHRSLDSNRSISLESEQQLMALLDASPCGFITVDAQGQVLFSNPIARHMLGLSAEALSDWQLGIPLVQDKDGYCKPEGQELQVRNVQGGWSIVTMTATPIRWDHQPAWLLSWVDITKLKEKEAALAREEAYQRLLIENMPLGVVIFDTEARILHTNSHACQLFQRPLEELIGLTLEECAPIWVDGSNQPLTPSQCPAHQVIATEDLIRSVEVGMGFSPKVINWMLVTAFPILDEMGMLTQVVMTLMDINPLKAVQQRLQASQKRFASLAQMAPVGIFRTDRDGNYIYVNEGWCQITGMKPYQAMGGLWLAHLSTEDVIKVGQEWEATKQQNRPFFLEHRFQKSSEETVWVVNRAVAEYDATGAVVGYVGTLTDITTRKQAEQQLQDFNRILEQRVHDRTAALQDSRHLIQRITETSPDILYIYDVEEEQMVYVNREITGLLGYPASEAAALGPTWFQSLLHPDDRDRVAQHYQEIRGIPATELTKAVREIEYRMRNRDGQWHWFSSRESFFFVNAQGFVQQVIGAASEITAQKNIEAQLRQSHTDLAQATRLKNQFLSAMSHELRTPLNAVLGMTEALLSQAYGALNHRQESALQTMARSGNELLRLISDILTLVQIEAQSLNLQKTLVNPAQLCTQTAALVQTQARRKNINLKLQLQLPSTPIELDTQQIQKMLLNLLSNGIKFTPSGGTVTLHGTYLIWSDSLHSTPPLLTLHTPAPAGTPTCCLSIEDTGIGMAAHDIDQLFQPFVQGDGRLTRQQGGTGLGLALVKQILELHQGWLQVWSSANQGSRFVIYLPWHPIPQEITASFSPAADLTSAPEPVTPEPVTPEPVAPSPAPLPKPDSNPDSPNPDVISLAPAVAPTVATPPPTGTDRSAPPASPPRMISPAPSVAVQPTQQAHRRLLLADANEANIVSFSDYLSQRGYEVIVATTAPEVLIRVQADQPDLLLMDLQSPKMGGPQIISQLRARSDCTHLPILVLCPADRPEANTPAIEAGATLLIPKPIRLKDLSAIIRQHITPPHPT